MFTKENIWYEQHHSPPTSFIDEYRNNIQLFIDRIKNNVNINTHKISIKNNLKTAIIKYPSPGNMEVHEISLLDHINDIINQQVILTPSGTCYLPTKIRQSHFSIYINKEKSARKIIKKEMAQLEAMNEKYKALIKHFDQLGIKIGINAMTGITDKNVYFKFISGYNSITSTARHNVMCGYAIIERFLASNFYFPTYNDTINHIISLLKIYPGDDHIQKIIKKYRLYIPTPQDILTFLSSCTYEPVILGNKKKAYLTLINSLNPYERCFVYYAQNFYHIVFQNSDIFKPFFQSCFNFDSIDEVIKDQDLDHDLFDVDDIDLLIAIVTFSYQLLKGKTLDDINNKHPDIKREILKRYYYLQHQLSYLNDIFDTFLLIYLNIHKPFEHPNMIRKCVILSDTDSNIFTTIRWIYWFTNNIVINDKAIEIHSLIVYFVTKMLEHILALSCKECNIEYPNIKKVSMKNEYLYKVLIRTIMNKHYFGYITIKEGVVLPEYKFDFKGKNFKGSDLSPEILKWYEIFARYLLDEIESKYYLDYKTVITKVIEYENQIKNSILKRNSKYLFNIPVQNKEEYKEYLQSHYFNYMFYDAVFAEKYGKINVPNKFKLVSLKTKITYKLLQTSNFFKEYSKKYPKIYQNMLKFLSHFPNKTINLILIPQDIKIPKELMNLIDINTIIKRNLVGIYLMCRSLGIVHIENNNICILFSKMYKDLINHKEVS